jgi:hypothetical protein
VQIVFVDTIRQKLILAVTLDEAHSAEEPVNTEIKFSVQKKPAFSGKSRVTGLNRI